MLGQLYRQIHLWLSGTTTTAKVQDIAYVAKTSIADGVATDTTGAKLTYTVPASKEAIVLSSSWLNVSGTPTVQQEFVRGASVVVLRSDTAGYKDGIALALEAADVFRFNVTAAGTTGSTADALISVRELR